MHEDEQNKFHASGSQMQDLARSIKRNEEKMGEILKSNNTLTIYLNDIKSTNRKTIEEMQTKIIDIHEETLKQTNLLEHNNETVESRIEEVNKLFETQKQFVLDSNKKLALYLSEREQISNKMEQLFEHIYGHVSYQQFEKYKKYQTIEIKSTLERVQAMVDSALTPEVRKFLPFIIQQVQQLKKISGIQQGFNSLVGQVENMKTEMKDGFEESKENLKGYVEGFRNQLNQHASITSTKEQLSQTNKEINELIRKVSESLNEGIIRYVNQLKEGINQLELQTDKKLEIKLNTSEKGQILDELSKTNGSLNQYINAIKSDLEKNVVATQNSEIQIGKMVNRVQNLITESKQEIVKIVKNSIPQEEFDFFNSLKELSPKIQKIRQNMQAKASVITSIAGNLEETLQKFSNRITKIKTDMELHAAYTKADVRALNKHKQELDKRIQKISKILSMYAEELIILNTFLIHGESKRNHISNGQVFISFFDGLVYEIKTDKPEDVIAYRKKEVNKYDFIRANLTCFLAYTDTLFHEEFLGWNKDKPSNLFKINIIQQLEHEKNKFGKQDNIMPSLNRTIQIDKERLMISSRDEEQKQQSSLDVFSRTTDLRGFTKLKFLKKKKKQERYSELPATTRQNGVKKQLISRKIVLN